MDDMYKMLCNMLINELERLHSAGELSNKAVKAAIARAFECPMERLRAFESWKQKIEESGDNEGWACAFTYWREAVKLSDLRTKAVSHLLSVSAENAELKDQITELKSRLKIAEIERDNLKTVIEGFSQVGETVSQKLKSFGSALISTKDERDLLRNTLKEAEKPFLEMHPRLQFEGGLPAATKAACEEIQRLRTENSTKTWPQTT